jgi:hypothetical protein
MFFFDLFQSFLPLHNPIGFGASDLLELVFASLLLVFVFTWKPFLEAYVTRLSGKTLQCMLLFAVLPVALRLLLLLPHHPVPTPEIYDEFGHLLVADTLRHFRLANPPHPLSQFFETFFVLQQPTYSSIYPIGQGLSQAIGWTLLGHPWAGVVLSVAAFCALCYWMLRAWTTPGWAFLGGVLAVLEFGPLNLWMNSYWGGSVTALAGCLVFGALPRLADVNRNEKSRIRVAVLLGLGLAIHLLTRPYESIFLLASVVLFFLPIFFFLPTLRKMAKPVLVAALVVAPAIGITLLQNRQVTGSWTTLPYQVSQYQYGVPAALTIQADPVPHRQLTPQQELGYKMQRSFKGNQPETIGSYLLRLEYRVRFYRFFFLAPLYLALPAFPWKLREYRFLWVLLTVTLFALGVNFFPAFQFHYVAAVTCLFILMSVVGLEQISRWTIRGWPGGYEPARLIIFVCIVHFVFWYSLHMFDDAAFSMALRRYESWDVIDRGNSERRLSVSRQLAQTQGKQLVFVRYWPQHIFQDEWVYNAADIDGSRVVWARDLGDSENEKLIRYYPDRKYWLLEPDVRPPRLTEYRP